MTQSPLKIIPILENIVVLPNLADKLNLWRDKFTAEAAKKGYVSKTGKSIQSIELRKNYRGRTEILFFQDQNNLLTNFSYKAPFYCKFILWASFVSFFPFLIIEAFLSALAESYHFNYSHWAIVVGLSSLCLFAGFGLAFVFLIARYNSKRNILLPDQRIELINTAQTLRIAQDSSVISESNYLAKPRLLPNTYFNIKIIYSVPNINVWKEKFLDIAKENSYLIIDKDFFNYLQLMKDGRKFDVGFKWNSNILLVGFQFRPHYYYFAITFGLLSGFMVSLALYYILDHSFLFLVITIIILVSYGAFRIWYILAFQRTTPEYVTDLKVLASKAAEFP